MKYWLVKFAPFRYSWEDCLKNGEFEIYSVRNFQARNNLKEMKIEDRVLFYHSQRERKIMGEMKVIEEAHQDFTTNDSKWVSVTFEPLNTFENPVKLQQLKKDEKFQNIGLIKQPRLSVMPLPEGVYNKIVMMGGIH